MKKTLMMKRAVVLIMLVCMSAVPALSEEITGDVFGKKRRHVHFPTALSFEYTDNLYNSPTDEESDFSVIFSPTIAFALPGTREVDITMATDTAAPGGLSISRDKIDSTDRYLAYLIYNPKAQWYADNSEENLLTHTLKAAGQYNAPGGLSVDLAGRYSLGSEVYGEVGSRDLDEYTDLLGDLIVRYDISRKLFVTAGVSGYKLDYERTESSFRNRSDLLWNASAGFRISPKTEVALEYQGISMDYQSAANIGGVNYYHDSKEHRFSGNISWKVTAKTLGKFKIGYMNKNMDKGSDHSDLFTELHFAYNFTTRTSIQVAAGRQFYETNFGAAEFYTSDRISMGYAQELTSKIIGKLDFNWNGDNYTGVDLDNQIFRISPVCEFNMNDWLSLEAGYAWEKRTSNEDLLEYDTNKVFLGALGHF